MNIITELMSREADVLSQLNPDLVKVIEEARNIGELTFVAVDGKRSKERHKHFWYKGEAPDSEIPRQFGAAVTLFVFLEEIPCFSKEIYIELAECMRFAGENLEIPMCWGGAEDPEEGYVDITQFPGLQMEQIYTECYSKMIDSEKEFNPRLQYFELYLD